MNFCFYPLSDINIISEGLVRLLESIKSSRSSQFDSSLVAEDIGKYQRRLLCQIQALRGDDSPSIQATIRSVELIVHLSSGCPSKVNLTPIADQLKEALCRLQLRQCFYMDLTSCQLMIGAIAAEKGSKTRAWFVTTLKTAVLVLKSRGWDDPLNLLKKGFISRSCLMVSFECLWNEIGSQNVVM